MNLLVLGNKIRQRREARGLKQTDIAHALQISAQAVSKWERGENAPDISLLPGLTKLLGISVDWLLGSYDTDKDVFEATVFVSSVLGYAKRAQTEPLKDMASWANALLYQLTETVLRFDGVPVKQLADGMLCFFSGNRHIERSIEAAQLVARMTNEPLKIALASGQIYLGSLGHPDYAQLDIMGEPVNTAFCSLTWLGAEGKSGIVATQTVVASLEERQIAAVIGNKEGVSLTGMSEPVALFEILR